MRIVDKKYQALAHAIQANDGVPCEDIPHAFYPEDYGVNAEFVHKLESMAIKICKSCPVQKLCLDYALTAREPYGIWGGTKPSER